MTGMTGGGAGAQPDPERSSLDQLRAWFEPRLLAAIPPAFAEPRLLHEAMVYACESGKRIRPLLCLASAAACAGNLEDAVPASIALELVHSYSLVHDDLPALDDDDTRRGRPSVHARYGEALALLAGDALLTGAFGVLGAPTGEPAGLGGSVIAAAGTAGGAAWAVRQLAIARELAVGAGSLGMVGGQAAELVADPPVGSQDRRWPPPVPQAPAPQPPPPPPAAEDAGQGQARDLHSAARYVIEHKTGALFRTACRIGGLAASGGPALLAGLTRFGATYGLAYQILDDLNDEERDRARQRRLNVAILMGTKAAIGLFIQARGAAESALQDTRWPGPTCWLSEAIGILDGRS